MRNDPAFIIGNGESRRNFDLNHIKGVAPIFGCNALYRTFKSDWLVAVDQGMIDEISSSDFPVEYTLFPRSKSEEYEPAEMHPGRNRFPRNNSGMYAMQRAIEKLKITAQKLMRNLKIMLVEFVISNGLQIKIKMLLSFSLMKFYFQKCQLEQKIFLQ